MPEKLAEGPFRLFPSRPENQSRTDDFLRSCGSIQLAERMLGWLREGLVSGEYREDGSGEEKFRVLLLRTADPSLATRPSIARGYAGNPTRACAACGAGNAN